MPLGFDYTEGPDSESSSLGGSGTVFNPNFFNDLIQANIWSPPEIGAPYSLFGFPSPTFNVQWGPSGEGGRQITAPPEAAWQYPDEVQQMWDAGTVTGLSYEDGTWQEVTGTPEVVWWEPTGTVYYQGVPLTEEQWNTLYYEGPDQLVWNPSSGQWTYRSDPTFTVGQVSNWYTGYHSNDLNGIDKVDDINRALRNAGYDPTDPDLMLTYEEWAQVLNQDWMSQNSNEVAAYALSQMQAQGNLIEQGGYYSAGGTSYGGYSSYGQPGTFGPTGQTATMPMSGGASNALIQQIQGSAIGQASTAPSLPPENYYQYGPEVQQAYEQGTATGLSYNPQTGRWEETTGNPEVVLDAQGNLYYHGIRLTEDQWTQLYWEGPDSLEWNAQYQNWMEPTELQGFSFTSDGGWQFTDQNPELIYDESTGKTYYNGQELTEEQFRALMLQGPAAFGNQYLLNQAIQDLLVPPDLSQFSPENLPFVEAGHIQAGYLTAPPTVQTPQIDAAQATTQIHTPNQIVAPTVYAPSVNYEVLAPYEIEAQQIAAQQIDVNRNVQDVNRITPQMVDPRYQELQNKVEQNTRYAQDIDAQQVQAAQVATPDGPDFREALFRSEYEPFKREWEYQKEVEQKKLQEQLAMAGLATSGSGFGIMGDQAEMFDRRLADAAAEAADKATVHYYDYELERRSLNANLEQQAKLSNQAADLQAQIETQRNFIQVNQQKVQDMLRAAEISQNAELANQAADLQAQVENERNTLALNEQRLAATTENARLAQEAALANQQAVLTADMENERNFLAAQSMELDRLFRNADYLFQSQVENAANSLQAQTETERNRLQASSLELQRDMNNARMLQEARLANAGFSLQAQVENAKNILTTNITNLDAAMQAAVANQNADMQAQIQNLQAYTQTLGISLQAMLGVRDDLLQTLGLAQEDLARLDNAHLTALSLVLTDRANFLRSVIDASKVSFSQSESEVDGGTTVSGDLV